MSLDFASSIIGFSRDEAQPIMACKGNWFVFRWQVSGAHARTANLAEVLLPTKTEVRPSPPSFQDFFRISSPNDHARAAREVGGNMVHHKFCSQKKP
jgi:hypothetical protein